MIGKPGALQAGGTPSGRPGFLPRLKCEKPAYVVDPTTGRKLTRGYEFQVKFVGLGHVVLDRFRLHAQKQAESPRAVNKP